ncbi:hypothetical protein HR45_06470 [Shewanella mangrovi]|uniref:Glycosyl transferase family 51 domain-containing protein n=1 Tax=Shewanella mangrovi TaxID=1515746 RepID=A0A094JJB8_9GAMM|nr:transglycosylase domain-containing protein [Shewanella mangrovi]KFZ38144.1 hypothetical protein HR45_06470 [Shewanella mangrovi]
MAKRAFLKFVYILLSLPMLVMAVLCYFFNIGNVRFYYNLCINTVRENDKTYPQELIQCLYLGEDKRGQSHLGVDYFGIVRAIWSIIKGRIQGASTIEQQFVRTVIGRYERTLTRKFFEQLLSHLVCLRLKKQQIAESYLSIAFFGSQMRGLSELIEQLSPESFELSFYAGAVARLKYPQPERVSPVWLEKHSKRTEWIVQQYNSANKLLNNEKKRLVFFES